MSLGWRTSRLARPPTTLNDLDRLLLGLGVGLLLAGLIIFIAANWASMGLIGRFALAQGAVIGSVALAYGKGLDQALGRAGLIAAAVSVGPLFALIGQTYQTGADPWQLFALWAALITPWMLIGRSPCLVLGWLLLLDVAVDLWWQIRPGLRRWDDPGLMWILMGIHGAALIAWEMLWTRLPWLAVTWAQRPVALILLILATGDALSLASGESSRLTAALPLLITLGGGWWAWRFRRPDLLLLTAGCLACIVLITIGAGRLIIRHGAADGFFITGLLVVGMTSTAGWWLHRVATAEKRA